MKTKHSVEVGDWQILFIMLHIINSTVYEIRQQKMGITNLFEKEIDNRRKVTLTKAKKYEEEKVLGFQGILLLATHSQSGCLSLAKSIIQCLLNLIKGTQLSVVEKTSTIAYVFAVFKNNNTYATLQTKHLAKMHIYKFGQV